MLMRLTVALLCHAGPVLVGRGLAWTPRRPGPQPVDVVVAWSRLRWWRSTREGRYVPSGGMVVEERARRIVLGMHKVDVGSAWWPMGGGGEDVGVELDESLEALQEQLDEARCHAPLLVIR